MLSFEKLYKFGFDKQANQKYQCKECARQFVKITFLTILIKIKITSLLLVKLLISLINLQKSNHIAGLFSIQKFIQTYHIFQKTNNFENI